MVGTFLPGQQLGHSLCTGWPQTWNTWNTWKIQGIWKIVNISEKTQGKLNFCGKNLENSRKMKNMWHDHLQNCIPSNFPLFSCSGKYVKMPQKSQGKLREFSFSKTWPLWLYCMCILYSRHFKANPNTFIFIQLNHTSCSLWQNTHLEEHRC